MLILLATISSLQSIAIKDSVLSSGFQNSANGLIYQQGTIGQVSTDVMSNGSYTLSSGYWQPLIRPLDSGIQGTARLITYGALGGLVTDVTITVNGNTVNPDANGYFSIILDPGIYTLSATLAGYNPVEITGIEVTSSQYAQRNVTLADWVPISGTQYSMLMLSSVVQGAEPVSGSNGNLLAAFGPGGNQDCRGIGMWIPDLGVYYMDVVGNIGGQVISFKFLDQTHGQVFDCTETITFIDNTMIGAFDNPFLLHLPLGNITNLIIQRSGNNIVLTWDGPDEVDYHIYRSTNAYSGFSDIGTVQVRYFTDVNITGNPMEFYRITYEP